MSKRTHKDSDDDNEPSTIDVDFDFFDPNPQTDYHALLRLLRQLFLPNPSDNPADPEIDLHGLAELVLAQPLVGTTIKTDGRESDPLAVLTVLNLSVHQVRSSTRLELINEWERAQKETPSIKSLIAYILNKSSSNIPLHATLQSLLPTPNNPNQNSPHVGFIFSERLINMPVQVVPPMYRMLADEIKWALDDVRSVRLSFSGYC
jgi:protein BCP1